jgi:hypothetical protein
MKNILKNNHNHTSKQMMESSGILVNKFKSFDK